MPRIQWPQKSSRRKRYVPVAVLSAILILVEITVGMLPFSQAPVALAATQLPDPALSDQPLFQVVSQSSQSNVIDAPDDYLKIYFNATTVHPSIEIFGMTFDPCGNMDAGYDYVQPFAGACTYPPADPTYQVDYDFYNTDNMEQPVGPPLLSLNGANGTNAVTGAPVIPEPARNSWTSPIPLAVTSPVSALTGYRVVYVHVHFNAPKSGAISVESHAYQFRTTIANDQLGYVSNTSPLGSQPPNGQLILDTIKPGVGQYEVNYELDFAPDCTMTSPQNVALRWYNASNATSLPAGGTDGTEWPGDTNPSFTFYQIPPSGAAPAPITIYHWKDGQASTPDIGGEGPGSYEELPFTAHPGWKYRWVWNNVDAASANFQIPPNNIMMWIPYDSINYSLNCNYTMGLTANGTSPTVIPGQTGTIDLSLQNKGPNSSEPGALQVQWPGAQVTKPCGAGNCADANQTGLTFGQTADGFENAGSEVPGVNGANWYWSTSAFPDNGLATGTLTFDVPSTAPAGTLTFDVYYAPGDNTGTVLHATVSFTVLALRTPAVVGLNGDVHAGSGTCNGVANPGPNNVEGNANTTSYAQFVVSANGSISNFGSNGTAGGTALNVGANGAYASVCNADLSTAAQDMAMTDPADITAIMPQNTAATPYDISNWSGVYFIQGNAYIYASGPVQHKMTIVSQGGDMHITGNIALASSLDPTCTASNPAAKCEQSVGLISTGNIDIAAPVLRVDAYMFAHNTVDTCESGTGSCATQPLVVNGFLMGNNLAFDRLGPLNTTGSQVAEEINLNPQIYLNPPVLFDSQHVDGAELEGLGERSPLF